MLEHNTEPLSASNELISALLWIKASVRLINNSWLECLPSFYATATRTLVLVRSYFCFSTTTSNHPSFVPLSWIIWLCITYCILTAAFVYIWMLYCFCSLTSPEKRKTANLISNSTCCLSLPMFKFSPSLVPFKQCLFLWGWKSPDRRLAGHLCTF